MSKQILKITGILAVLMLLATACNKEALSDFTTSEDASDIETLFTDIEDETDYQLEFASGGGGSATPCVTFTWAQPVGTYPNTLTIDFGQGCVGRFGRVRAGQLIVTISDNILTTGATRTVTPNNFTIDSVAITGTVQWVNNGGGSFTRTVTNGQITRPDGTIVRSWNSSYTWALNTGTDPDTFSDDTITITGSASGVNRNGKNFTTTIVTPLVRARDCRWIGEGTIDHTVDGNTFTLDYGTGSCDRQATVTGPNGNTRTILLRN